MTKPDPSVAVTSLATVILGVLAGCGRSEESIKAEFATYVEGANQCETATDCALATPGCPLGCFVAVRADRKADVERRARALISSYEAGGARCVYDCAVPGPLSCKANRCAVAPVDTPSGAGGPLVQLPLFFEPLDGTTNVGERPLTVSFGNPFSGDDEFSPVGRLLAELPSSMVLETWPERTPVPGHVVPGVRSVDTRALQLIPDAPLEARWYLFRLKSLPAITTSPRLDDGTVGARFRPDSHPRVANVQFCDKDGGGMKLVVQFSETMVTTPDSGGAVFVEIDGQPAACPLYWAIPEGLYFTCEALAPGVKVKVSVGAGPTSKTGAALAPWTLMTEVSRQEGISCRVHNQPL